MGKRILTWSTQSAPAYYSGESQYTILPRYYMEADYAPIAVRTYVQVPPSSEDAEFDIYVDGVSIFANRASNTVYEQGGVQTYATAITKQIIDDGESEQVDAEDFRNELVIEQGSWVSCRLIKDGGGQNFSIHLELSELDEEGESED